MEPVTNHITLRGCLTELPCFSHENHGRRFFRFLLEVPRLSGAVDTLPVIIEESILNTLKEKNCPAVFFICLQRWQLLREVF